MNCDFPRLSELKAISVALNSSDAYFQADDDKFDAPFSREHFLRIEDDLRGLDSQAWQALKEAASKCLKRTKDRDWQPLFDTLNEAKAYNYLTAIGCTAVSFIPRSSKQGQRTPDLQAMSGSTKTLCEVKTINTSTDEIERFRSGGVGTTLLAVSDEMLGKITGTLKYADDQMSHFDSIGDARKIVYMIVNFDNNADMAIEYQRQVRQHVSRVTPSGIEVELFFKEPFQR